MSVLYFGLQENLLIRILSLIFSYHPYHSHRLPLAQSPKVQTELSQQALYDYMMSIVLILIMFGLAALFVGQGVKFIIKWHRQWWAKRNPEEAKARAARANLREPVYCGQRETEV